MASGAGISVTTITDNTVTGQGPGFDNAQNGIQVSFGASAQTISKNTVTENIYTQTGATGYIATGILIDLAGQTPNVGQLASLNTLYDNQANVMDF